VNCSNRHDLPTPARRRMMGKVNDRPTLVGGNIGLSPQNSQAPACIVAEHTYLYPQ
jgi:hypothetical protein